MAELASHYAAIRGGFDYDEADFAVGDLAAGIVERSFAATTDAGTVASAPPEDTLFVASAGLSGTPHAGTVAQMFAVKRLHEAGFDTEFLLADYEKYAGSGRNLDAVRDLASDYREFLDGIGYDGRVRTQYDADDVMQTAFRLAPWFEFDAGVEFDREPTTWERELREAYEADQIDHDDATGSTEFAGRLSALLCLADFMHPSLAEDYDHTVFVLGIDEHELYQFNRAYVEPTPFDPAFDCLFTRMVRGFDGYPKMAKTIPGTGVTMDMAPDRIRRLVRNAERREDPIESPVYQMLCLVSEYGPERLAELERTCRAGGEDWDAAVAEYADWLAALSRAWPA
jgi:tryptophanyl-tRNA synthetase